MLVIPRKRYDSLLTAYEKWYGPLDHSLFLEVGQSVRAKRFYTLEELWQVAHWKVGSARNDTRIEANTERGVERLTGAALRPALSDRARVEELWKLDGVSTPIASALLAVWNPKNFAIIDKIVWGLCAKRSWLDGRKSYDGLRPFDTFLDFVRTQRDELGREWTARKVEQALYALADRLS